MADRMDECSLQDEWQDMVITMLFSNVSSVIVTFLSPDVLFSIMQAHSICNPFNNVFKWLGLFLVRL